MTRSDKGQTHKYPDTRAPIIGAGRAPIGPEPMEKHTITISAQDWQYLREQGESASEGLRVVIKFHKEHK